MRYSSMSPNSSSAAASLGAPTRTPRSVFAFSAEIASRRSPSTLIVFCHGKSLREPDTTYFAFASSFVWALVLLAVAFIPALYMALGKWKTADLGDAGHAPVVME